VLGSLVGTGSPVGMSVGLAYTEDGALGGPQLLSQADQALYEAKRAGKGRIGAAPSCSPRELAAAAAHGQAGG
jgi:GGDEF domain-containing protein